MRVGGPTGDKKFCWTKGDVLLDSFNDDNNPDIKIYVQGFPPLLNCPQVMPYYENYYYNDYDGNGFYAYPCWGYNPLSVFGSPNLVMNRPDRCDAPNSVDDGCGWLYEDRCKFKYKNQDAYFKP